MIILWYTIILHFYSFRLDSKLVGMMGNLGNFFLLLISVNRFPGDLWGIPNTLSTHYRELVRHKSESYETRIIKNDTNDSRMSRIPCFRL